MDRKQPGPAQQLAEPTLGTTHAIAQAMAVGPIYSAAIFGSLIAATAGSVGPFVVLITTIGVLALAYVVAAYARRFAGPGAVYEYVAQTLGRKIGVGTSFAYAWCLLFLGPPFLIPGGFLFKAFAEQHLGFSPPWWVGGIAAMLIVFALQSFGVRLSVRAQLTLTVLSAVPIVVLIVAIIVGGGAHGNTLSVFNPAEESHRDTFRALLFAVTLFIGFETAASLGAEAKDPYRTIPRAMIGTVVISAVWYLLILYIGTIGFGPAQAAAEWGKSPNGLAELARQHVGSLDSTLIQIAVMCDVIAVWMAGTNSYSRTMYALARDGLVPRAFARTSSRGVPFVGNLSWVASTLLLLVVTIASGMNDKYLMLSIVVSCGALVILLIYFVLVVGSLRLLPPGPRWLVPLIAGSVPVLGIWGTIVPFPVGELRWAVWLTIACIVICIAATAYLSARRPQAMSAAGEPLFVAEGHHVVPDAGPARDPAAAPAAG